MKWKSINGDEKTNRVSRQLHGICVRPGVLSAAEASEHSLPDRKIVKMNGFDLSVFTTRWLELTAQMAIFSNSFLTIQTLIIISSWAKIIRAQKVQKTFRYIMWSLIYLNDNVKEESLLYFSFDLHALLNIWYRN